MFWHLFFPLLSCTRLNFLWLAERWCRVRGLLRSQSQTSHPLLHAYPHQLCREVPHLFASPGHSVFSLLSCNLHLAELFLCVPWYISTSALDPQGKLSLVQFLCMAADFLDLALGLTFHSGYCHFNSLCWPKLWLLAWNMLLLPRNCVASMYHWAISILDDIHVLIISFFWGTLLFLFAYLVCLFSLYWMDILTHKT